MVGVADSDESFVTGDADQDCVPFCIGAQPLPDYRLD